jgi:hypothetical protein
MVVFVGIVWIFGSFLIMILREVEGMSVRVVRGLFG